jgi:SAM-dependent methyltransferase
MRTSTKLATQPSATKSRRQYQYGWNHPVTARFYEAFCKQHSRYIEANAYLVQQADLKNSQLVLDFAAGTGRTAEAVLPFIGETGRIVCVEPSTAMRWVGMQRLGDPRLSWRSVLPAAQHQFDRVLCGAAIWQILPLHDVLERLANQLKAGGALCFNIPALYLGQADDPGDGSDPTLLGLPTLLAPYVTRKKVINRWDPHVEVIENLLVDLGLEPKQWEFQIKLTQADYLDWLKIPPVTDAFLGHLSATERSNLLAELSLKTDLRSWRWERWIGWTASS